MITRMKKANNFQTAKIPYQGVAELLFDFFTSFSLVLLMKVLPIKKGVYIKKLKTEVWNNAKISKFLLDLKFPFIALKCDNYLKALMYNNFKITKEATVTKSTIS